MIWCALCHTQQPETVLVAADLMVRVRAVLDFVHVVDLRQWLSWLNQRMSKWKQLG
jgi:hypothetical protein